MVTMTNQRHACSSSSHVSQNARAVCSCFVNSAQPEDLLQKEYWKPQGSMEHAPSPIVLFLRSPSFLLLFWFSSVVFPHTLPPFLTLSSPLTILSLPSSFFARLSSSFQSRFLVASFMLVVLFVSTIHPDFYCVFITSRSPLVDSAVSCLIFSKDQFGFASSFSSRLSHLFFLPWRFQVGLSRPERSRLHSDESRRCPPSCCFINVNLL